MFIYSFASFVTTTQFDPFYMNVFFSSRRRHTRYWRDWSSDVCSSDLATRNYLEKLITEGYVLCNEKVITKNGKKLKGKEIIQLCIPEEEEMNIEAENIPLDIVYEDEYLLVVNKPANMVVHPALGNYTGTLVNALLYYCKENLSDMNGVIRPGIVHRLDKDTTGLIIVAKNNQVHSKLALMFQEKTIRKTYVAIVKGRFSEERKEGYLETLIARDQKDRKKMTVSQVQGKKAISCYRVLINGEKHSLVEVNIETGRTHQIRVHMKYLKDRKSTRLNSSHANISYAVFCLKKKKLNK